MSFSGENGFWGDSVYKIGKLSTYLNFFFENKIEANS